MSKVTLKPLNDYLLVEVGSQDTDGLEIDLGEHGSVQKGKVLSVGAFGYISTNSWVLPLGDSAVKVAEFFNTLVGKTIYWEKYTDNNATIEHTDGKKYAFIKLSKIVGFEE